MTGATDAENVRRLLDRAEIADVIGAYCYGMDSRDWDLYRSCWTDEVELNFPQLDDAPMPTIAADDWVRSVATFFTALPKSQHISYPVRYEFAADGDSATVIALLHARHWMLTDTGGPVQAVVGYYENYFVRTAAGWKMSGMKETVYWNEGNSHVLDVPVSRSLEVLKELGLPVG